MIRRNHKCIDRRSRTDGYTDKVIMNYAFTFFPSQWFRDLLVQDDLPVVVWDDDIVDFSFGGFIVSMNSAGHCSPRDA